MTPQTLATLYAGLAVLPLTLQLALAAGVLLGRFTLSGRFAGRLPPLWRGLAVVQAGLLAAMACAVLDRGSAINLGLAPTAFWQALATTGLTLLAKAVSQSRRERLLWTPITLAMTCQGCLRGEAATANNTRIVVRHFARLSIRCRVLPIGCGWYYLSTILDDYSRYFIAWKLCTTMKAGDVTDTPTWRSTHPAAAMPPSCKGHAFLATTIRPTSPPN